MGDREVAKIHGWYVPLTEERLRKIRDREVALQKPTVLHQLFTYFYDNFLVDDKFLNNFLWELNDMYCKCL